MDIVDSGASGKGSEVENPESTWYTQAGREQQFGRPMDVRVLGESSDLLLGGRFVTPTHVLPMIVTLDGDALADN
jgi:hypothetical protein